MTDSAGTRQRLVDAATNLFWEQGFAGTGLSDIIREAGVHGGSLYHFFKTKDALLLAVLDHHRVLLETVILRAGQELSDPVDRVMAIAAFYRQFMERTGCALGCPIGNLAGEVSDTYPEAREKIAALMETFRAGIRSSIGGGERSESLRISGPDQDSIATLVVGAIEGAVMQARAARDIGHMDAALGTLRALLTLAREPARESAEPAAAAR